LKWYVICIKPKWYFKVLEFIQKTDIEYFFPTYRTVKQWSDRKKKVQMPLFKTYAFVRLSSYEREKLNVLSIPGVQRFLWIGQKPCIAKDNEIEGIRKFISDYAHSIIDINLEIGTQVSVTRGLFAGQTGKVNLVQGNRVHLALESIGIFLNVALSSQVLEPVTSE